MALALWWLEHILGIDTQLSPFYDFWSGFGAAAGTWLGIGLAWFALRIELRALKLETELLRRELDRADSTRPNDKGVQ